MKLSITITNQKIGFLLKLYLDTFNDIKVLQQGFKIIKNLYIGQIHRGLELKS